jgi:1,2-diacylglycerol 3-alpha-glucosyltransferase
MEIGLDILYCGCMNILLVTETYLPYITGVSISTDNIARFMLLRGHNVTLICPRPTVKREAIYPKGLKIVHIPSLPFSFYNNNATGIFPLTLFSIKKVFDSTKFDVVHIQEPGVVGISALILAKMHKIPIVGALHFIPEQIDRVLWGSFEKVLTPFINVLIRFVYNKYDEIMTPSHFFAGYLKNVGVTKPINVISNGVDTNLYKPQKPDLKTRSKYGLNKDDFAFLFLGRLDRDKNAETLVRAMPKTDSKVKLIIVGRGTESKFLHSLASKLKIESKIIWLDYVTDSEMLKLYSAVNAFCIMSPYEGQSIVTLQAVSSGLPVIAAKAGALPELISNNINGYLVGTYDHSTLAKKMNIIASSTKLQNKFGLESRKISLSHEKSVVLRKLERIYIMLKHVER